MDRTFAALPDVADVLGQWWPVSPSPLCPCLLLFLLPDPALSPLCSNQVASAALGAGWGSGRRQQVGNGAPHLPPTEGFQWLVLVSALQSVGARQLLKAVLRAAYRGWGRAFPCLSSQERLSSLG